MTRSHLSALILISLLWCAGPAAAQQPPAPSLDAPYVAQLAEANKAYNRSAYEEAIAAYVKAIQLNPRGVEAYRNMARALFWQKSYPQAVAYYDIYLREFPQVDDRAAIQQERNLAASRSPTPWQLPAQEREALEAMERALHQGPAMARGASAWKTYEALLRTDYARPELVSLRRRLVQRLLDEFDTLCAPSAGQPMPQLDQAAWELQRDRLDAVDELAQDDETRAQSTRRRLITQAALAMLSGRYDDAARQAAAAIEVNPEVGALRWLRVEALLQANQNEQALDALDALASVLGKEAPSLLPYEVVLRAMTLQKLGRHQQAADHYLELLR